MKRLILSLFVVSLFASAATASAQTVECVKCKPMWKQTYGWSGYQCGDGWEDADLRDCHTQCEINTTSGGFPLPGGTCTCYTTPRLGCIANPLSGQESAFEVQPVDELPTALEKAMGTWGRMLFPGTYTYSNPTVDIEAELVKEAASPTGWFLSYTINTVREGKASKAVEGLAVVSVK